MGLGQVQMAASNAGIGVTTPAILGAGAFFDLSAEIAFGL